VACRAFAISGVVLLLSGWSSADAQPVETGPYRQLSGSLVAGWLDTEAKEFFVDSRSNPFTTVRFDYRDAIVDPAFINYRVRPVFSAGFQDPFGGVSEGTGVSADVAFLPARPWPLRVYYSRFRRTALTATPNSSYTRYASQNDDSLLGLQWQLLASRMPRLDLTLNDSSVATRPEEVLVYGYESRSKSLALNATHTLGGWSLAAGVNAQRLSAKYLAASAAGAVALQTTNDLRTLLFQAQRNLGSRFSLSLNANGTTTNSTAANGYFRQRFDTYSARLLFEPQGRFSSWAEARLTRSDLESRSATIESGPAVVVPRTRTTNQIGDWEVRYRMLSGLSAFGRLEYTRVDATATEAAPRPGNFLNTVGGVQFSRAMKAVTAGASYTLFRYVTRFAAESETDQLGHALDADVSVGNPSVVRARVGGSLVRSRENVRAALPYTSDSQRVRAAVEKALYHGWTIEVHGDLTQTNYDRDDLHSDFRGQGFGGTFSAPGLSLSADRSYGSGDSVQQLLDPSAPPIPGVPPLLIVGSGNDATTISGGWAIHRSLYLRGVWRDQKQKIGALRVSRVEQREATLTYSFRLIRVEGGYLLYRFDFGSPVYRESLILRVTRDFRVF
jgi:hypothetical protein